MKKKLALALALAMTASLTLTSCGNSSEGGGSGSGSGSGSQTTSGGKQTLVLDTGGNTGTYYAVGSILQTTLNDVLTLSSLTTANTGASKQNIQDITDGTAQLAIVQSDALAYAHSGESLFEGTVEDKALWVAGLYNETVQITATGGITSVEDLKGKSVCVGDQGSGTEFNAIQVLEAYGMTEDDINVVYTDFGGASEMLKQGQIDAAFTVAGAPTTAITELATSGMDFSMVSLTQDAVDYLTEKYPFLVQENLPAGTYDGVDTETVCVATKAVLVASADLSEDVVYELTKAMFDNMDALGEGHDKFKGVTAELASADAAVEIHPGALRYYQEVGLLAE